MEERGVVLSSTLAASRFFWKDATSFILGMGEWFCLPLARNLPSAGLHAEKWSPVLCDPAHSKGNWFLI